MDMHEDTEMDLARVLDIIVDVIGPDRIYLFGSQARGDQNPDSDYDLLVVVSDDIADCRKHSRRVYEKLWKTGIAADVILFTRSRFDSRRHIAASLPATVLREGRIVYDA